VVRAADVLSTKRSLRYWRATRGASTRIMLTDTNSLGNVGQGGLTNFARKKLIWRKDLNECST
jgi:hypothetical protein